MDEHATKLQLSMEGIHAPDFPEAAGPWLNTEPFTLKQRQEEGKVVLLDIWTYSCINCIRTLPYLKRWYDEYKDKGLVVIGVHTPEFEFEKDHKNILEAIETHEITYPVVLDNDKRIWNAYANKAWPHKYVIDSKGIITFDHSGEGEYIETEQAIRKAINASRPTSFAPISTVVHHHGEGAVCYEFTNELYCGYYRGVIGNLSGFIEDQVAYYYDPGDDTYEDGQIYLDGEWESQAEYVRYAGDDEGIIKVFYHGTEVNIVAKNQFDNHTASTRRVYIELDDQPIDPDIAGDDVIVDDDGSAYVNVTIPKMYQLIRDPEYGEHVLTLRVKSPEFQIYAYTFGGCTES